jgi:hypothetical protein
MTGSDMTQLKRLIQALPDVDLQRLQRLLTTETESRKVGRSVRYAEKVWDELVGGK